MALTGYQIQVLGSGLGNRDVAEKIAEEIAAAAGSYVDGAEIYVGTGDDAGLQWSTNDASNHAAVLFLGDSNQALHVTDKGARDTDWNVSADTHPTLYVHSNTTPATDYLKIGGHDGTTAGIDVVGGTTLDLRIAGTDILVLTATTLTLADGLNLVLNSTTGTKIGTATTQKLGFYNATPVVQPGAYTQTYSTADKTHAAATAAALTVTDGAGTNDGTIGAITGDASVIAAVQELADQINKLVVDQLDTKQLVNAVIDDLQALGLVG